MSRSPTLRRAKPLTTNLKTPTDEENAGDWSEKASDGTSLTDVEAETKQEAKAFGTVSPWTGQGNFECWRGSDPRKSVLPPESVSESRDRSQVQKASRAVPQFCGRRKTGARRGRRGRRGNRAVPEHELQPRTTCGRWRRPTGGASVLPTSVRKVVRRQKLARSWRALKGWRKRAPTRSRRPLPRVISGSGACWEMVEKQETSDGHPYPDDGCNVLPTWRTLAVNERGLDQTNA